MFQFVSVYILCYFFHLFYCRYCTSKSGAKPGIHTLSSIHIPGSRTVPRSSRLRRMFLNSNMTDFQDGDWFLVDDVVRVVGVAHSICTSKQHLSNRYQHLFLTQQLWQLSIVLLSSKTKLRAAYKNEYVRYPYLYPYWNTVHEMRFW